MDDQGYVAHPGMDDFRAWSRGEISKKEFELRTAQTAYRLLKEGGFAPVEIPAIPEDVKEYVEYTQKEKDDLGEANVARLQRAFKHWCQSCSAAANDNAGKYGSMRKYQVILRDNGVKCPEIDLRLKGFWIGTYTCPGGTCRRRIIWVGATQKDAGCCYCGDLLKGYAEQDAKAAPREAGQEG